MVVLLIIVLWAVLAVLFLAILKGINEDIKDKRY